MWKIPRKPKWNLGWRPSGGMVRKGIMVLAMAAGCGGAFWSGQHWGAATADAQAPGNPAARFGAGADGRVVAYIYDSIPITREEFGEYLIARFGAERLESFVDRRIVELLCKSKGIEVSEADIDAQIALDLRSLGNFSLKDFEARILRPRGGNLYDFRETVRQKIAMATYARPLVTVTEEDLQKGFEGRYGPKVQCRLIVMQDDKHAGEVWEKVKNDSTAFIKAATDYNIIPDMRSRAGEVPPIHKHFGDRRIEDAAFSLKPGQVSHLIGMPDKTVVLLMCEKHVPPDLTKRYENERAKLSKEVADLKLVQKISEVQEELRKQANPKLYLQRIQVRQEDLERAAVKDFTGQRPVNAKLNGDK